MKREVLGDYHGCTFLSTLKCLASQVLGALIVYHVALMLGILIVPWKFVLFVALIVVWIAVMDYYYQKMKRSAYRPGKRL